MQSNLLDAEIARCGITVLDLCERTGISTSAYYRKRAGVTAFDTKDIKNICKVLHIDEPQRIKDIFLD